MPDDVHGAVYSKTTIATFINKATLKGKKIGAGGNGDIDLFGIWDVV